MYQELESEPITLYYAKASKYVHQMTEQFE